MRKPMPAIKLVYLYTLTLPTLKKQNCLSAISELEKIGIFVA